MEREELIRNFAHVENGNEYLDNHGILPTVLPEFWQTH